MTAKTLSAIALVLGATGAVLSPFGYPLQVFSALSASVGTLLALGTSFLQRGFWAPDRLIVSSNKSLTIVLAVFVAMVAIASAIATFEDLWWRHISMSLTLFAFIAIFALPVLRASPVPRH